MWNYKKDKKAEMNQNEFRSCTSKALPHPTPEVQHWQHCQRKAVEKKLDEPVPSTSKVMLYVNTKLEHFNAEIGHLLIRRQCQKINSSFATQEQRVADLVKKNNQVKIINLFAGYGNNVLYRQ